MNTPKVTPETINKGMEDNAVEMFHTINTLLEAIENGDEQAIQDAYDLGLATVRKALGY